MIDGILPKKAPVFDITPELGPNDNVDTLTTPGSIQIDSKDISQTDLHAIFDANNDSVTVSHNEDSKGNAVDGNSAPADPSWGMSGSGNPYWIMDLGETFPNATRVKIYNASAVAAQTNISDTAITCEAVFHGCTGTHLGDASFFENTFDFAPTPVRYLSVQYIDDNLLTEIQLFDSATATHTSDATQINGGDNFWGWETFTPTYDKPANTDVKFRFRTSINGSDPTDWSAYQTPGTGAPLNISSLVTSRDEGSGDDNSKDAANFTYYKYLQVETTLTSTDGAHTPTVSDYSLGYHTNTKPNKPVAGTAVIGN